jgi:hypothetical protein
MPDNLHQRLDRFELDGLASQAPPPPAAFLAHVARRRRARTLRWAALVVGAGTTAVAASLALVVLVQRSFRPASPGTGPIAAHLAPALSPQRPAAAAARSATTLAIGSRDPDAIFDAPPTTNATPAVPARPSETLTVGSIHSREVADEIVSRL